MFRKVVLVLCILPIAGSLVLAEDADELKSTPNLERSRSVLSQLFGPKNSYEKINLHLTKYVESDDLEPNLEEAKRYLAKKTKDGWSKVVNAPLVMALNNFISLANLTNKETGAYNCDGNDHQILGKITQCLHLYAKRRSGDLLDRLERIVSKSVGDHAKACASVYPASAEAKLKQLDKTVVRHVESFLDGIIEAKLKEANGEGEKNEIIYNEFIDKWHPVSGMKEGEIIFNELTKMAANDPLSRHLTPADDDVVNMKLIHEESIKSLLHKYLIVPCGHYVGALRSDVLIPAQQDMLSYREPASNVPLNFYMILARSRLCQTLVANHKQLTRILVTLSIEEP